MSTKGGRKRFRQARLPTELRIERQNENLVLRGRIAVMTQRIQTAAAQVAFDEPESGVLHRPSIGQEPFRSFQQNWRDIPSSNGHHRLAWLSSQPAEHPEIVLVIGVSIRVFPGNLSENALGRPFLKTPPKPLQRKMGRR